MSTRYHGILQHLRFFKENHAIHHGTQTIISTEPNNEMKYRENIDNTYSELVPWKRISFDLPK